MKIIHNPFNVDQKNKKNIKKKSNYIFKFEKRKIRFLFEIFKLNFHSIVKAFLIYVHIQNPSYTTNAENLTETKL